MKTKFITTLLIAQFSLVSALTLDIPSYPEESVIPNDHTFNSGGNCSGDNVSPQLIWSDAPDGTQSFAVVFIDENLSFLHWKLYNIDADVRHIPENNPNDVGTEGLTNFGNSGYGGPCPPSPTPGNYRMTVYALNTVFASEPSIGMIQAAAIESASYLAFRNVNDDQERYEHAARYKMTFQANWSANTHPIDYPASAHFSSLIGATHLYPRTIWEDQGIATEGVERMAETGGAGILSSEIFVLMDQAHVESQLVGPGADGVDDVELFFDVSESHPLVSLVTMIAPSPDWFVGVHGLSLREHGQWIDQLSIDLLPYDAGTQDGDSFRIIRGNTDPQQPITRITTNPLPNNVPLGQFVFELISTTGTDSGVIYAQGFEFP